ncbi:MAG: hypothetical protein ACJAWL_000623 [Motiliproteus sp.]|jgi:hypothetical protein
MSLALLHTTATGKLTRLVLPLSAPVPVTPEANYSLIDQATGTPPTDLRLFKDGDDLIITKSGEQLTKIENFFAQNTDATFATDGSTVAAQAPSGSLVYSTAEVTIDTTQAQGSLVWESQAAAASSPLSSTGSMLVFGGLVMGGSILVNRDSQSEAPSSIGFVADGYIQDAQLYADTNGNGIAEESELLVGVVTNEKGEFTLPAIYGNTALLAVGGTNTDTGITNTVVLSTPAGSLVVNPLTTIVNEYLKTNSGTTLEQAEKAVQTALGIRDLPVGQTLTTYDPIASNDVATQKIAAQIVEIAAQAQATSDDAAGTAGTQVFTNLAGLVKETTTGSEPLKLSDTTVIKSAIKDIQGIDEEASAAIAAQNQKIDEASDIAAISAQQKAPIVSLTTDTGVSQTDLVTNLGTLKITGKQLDATTEYSLNGDDNWTKEFKASEGSNTVYVRQVGPEEGQISSVTSLTFTYDSTAPDASFTINDQGEVLIQSTEVGTAYLVKVTKDSAAPASVADITSLGEDQYSSVVIETVDTDTLMAALSNGDYKLYSADSAGNLSGSAQDTVSISNTTSVVFNLAAGTSTTDAGGERIFDPFISYDISIVVKSNTAKLASFDQGHRWAGAENLGADDTITLVSFEGTPLQQNHQKSVNKVVLTTSKASWAHYEVIASLNITQTLLAANLTTGGMFQRKHSINKVSVDLWTGADGLPSFTNMSGVTYATYVS